MKIINQITVIAALILIFISSAAAQKSSDKAFDLMQTAHAAALKTWLAAKPNLRPATEADCANKEGLKLQRSGGDAGYQPYYFAGDFNADKREDFAVGLIDSKKRKDNFALVIFNGSKNGFRQAHYQVNLDLQMSGLFFFGENPERLAVGEFQTDNCSYFRWASGRYVAEHCTSGEN